MSILAFTPLTILPDGTELWYLHSTFNTASGTQDERKVMVRVHKDGIDWQGNLKKKPYDVWYRMDPQAAQLYKCDTRDMKSFEERRAKHLEGK